MEPILNVLSEKEVLKIDQASRALLMEVGTHVPHEEALEIFEKAGALVDSSTQTVRIPDHVINVQLGMEKLGTGLLPALAETNMVVGKGLFADENTISLETLVIDHEITGWIRQVLQGIEVTDETTDLEVFKEVGSGGDFVRLKHARENFRKEMFIPNIMDRGYLALDNNPKVKSMRKRARKYFTKVMRDYTPPHLPENIEARVDEIIYA